jgi:hypothetical protein
MTKKPESTEIKSQLDKFRQAARELECDDDDERFKDKIGRIAKPRPKQDNRPAHADD